MNAFSRGSRRPGQKASRYYASPPPDVVDHRIRRQAVPPCVYRVFLLPESRSGMNARRHIDPFTRSDYQRCVALLRVPYIKDGDAPLPLTDEEEDDEETEGKTRKGMDGEESQGGSSPSPPQDPVCVLPQATPSQSPLSLAPDAVVHVWPDTTFWELSYAGLRPIRDTLDAQFDAARRVDCTSAQKEKKRGDEEEGLGEAEADGERTKRYRLSWWSGFVSAETGRCSFQFLGSLVCVQVLAEHQMLSPLRASAAPGSARFGDVVMEMSNFPPPGMPLFLRCERVY